MPLMGGAPRPYLSERAVNVSWSPDNQRLAFHTRDAGDPIFVADRDGSNARQIFVGANPGLHNHFPVWSRTDDGCSSSLAVRPRVRWICGESRQKAECLNG
jgi:hypothetical protein